MRAYLESIVKFRNRSLGFKIGAARGWVTAMRRERRKAVLTNHFQRFRAESQRDGSRERQAKRGQFSTCPEGAEAPLRKSVRSLARRKSTTLAFVMSDPPPAALMAEENPAISPRYSPSSILPIIVSGVGFFSDVRLNISSFWQLTQ